MEEIKQLQILKNSKFSTILINLVYIIFELSTFTQIYLGLIDISWVHAVFTPFIIIAITTNGYRYLSLSENVANEIYKHDLSSGYAEYAFKTTFGRTYSFASFSCLFGLFAAFYTGITIIRFYDNILVTILYAVLFFSINSLFGITSIFSMRNLSKLQTKIINKYKGDSNV